MQFSKRVKDLAGKTFGRLKVLRYAGLDERDKSQWKCSCSCGATCTVRSDSLQSYTRSCGCLQRETAADRCSKGKTTARTHGHSSNGSRSPEYQSWSAMKARCSNSHNASWERYGGLGVRVCTRWLNAFEAFLKDLGPRPKRRDRRGWLVYTLDRINPLGHYIPDNCCWETRKVQQNNQRRHHNYQRMVAFVDAK